MLKKITIAAVLSIVVVISIYVTTVTATTVTGSPDLTALSKDLTINKSTVKDGDKVTLKAVIKNIGTYKAANVKVRFFYNNNQVYEKKVTSIGKNASSTVTYSYSLPVNVFGSIPFKVVIDPDNTIAELLENNNTIENNINVTQAKRDLQIKSIKAAPASPKVGQAVTWTIGVTNVGDASASNIKLEFYADNKSDNPTSTINIKSLSAKTSTTKTVKWTVPANISTAVGYAVRAVLDSDNKYIETNEANNISVFTINLTAPDLLLERDNNTYTKGNLYKGVRLAQWAKITNNNVMAVSNVKAGLYYYLNNDSDNLIKLIEQNVGTINKKSSMPIYLEGTLPTTIPLGTIIHVIVKADPLNEVVETNEENNILEAVRTLTEKPQQVVYPYLRIRVYDENGEPKNQATVKITNVATNTPETKTTGVETYYDSNGAVIFESRPDTATAYNMEVTCPGYRTVTSSFTFDKYIDESTEQYIYLDKKAQVSGTITGPSGSPLGGVQVRIEGTNLEAVSDYQGKYGFLLNGGTYTFRYVASGYARAVDANKVIAPLSTVTLNKTLSVATVGYISGTATDDEGNLLKNVDVWVDGNLIRVTGDAGKFDFTSGAANKKFTFKKQGYVTVEFYQNIVAGEEYDFSFTMYKPSTANHAERGTNFVSWHQHEGTPANAFFIPEYNVDIWWGLGNVKMGLDYNNDGGSTKATKLTIMVKGTNWNCYKVEGDAEVETSAIDIPITIAAGGCLNDKTQVDVYKVAIESDGQEVWADESFWTSASDPLNAHTKVFTLNNLSVNWNSDLKVKLWARMQKKAVIGTQGDGSGALSGYHLDKKLITWHPQKPATTKIKTSWGQIGGYFLGILDNPVNAIANFTDLFTVETFNQYDMIEVLPQDFPGYISN